MQAEAEAMRSMLLTLGMPASAIRLETLRRTTAENAQQGLLDTLHPLGRWLPDADSLGLSTRALKEYLGLAALRSSVGPDPAWGLLRL